MKNGILGKGVACAKTAYSWSAVLHWDSISVSRILGKTGLGEYEFENSWEDK